MLESKYYNNIKNFQEKVVNYTTDIFKVYGNELQLRLEDYNLLSHKENCLESSTAFGYIIEEFLVSKLEIFTKNHNHQNSEYNIIRANKPTGQASYDCSSEFDNILAYINIKANKNNNNAIAAINQLYQDYVLFEPTQVKCFLVLKVNYHFNVSKLDKERKIFIGDIDSFFLEELNFSSGHKQDSRSWSAEYNPNSGRLQVSNKFRNDNHLEVDKISYGNTFSMIQNIFQGNSD